MTVARPSKSQWLCLGGFACYWTWAFCAVLTNSFGARGAAGEAVDVWLVSTIFHIGTLLCLGALAPRAGSYLRNTLVVAMAPSACLAGFLLVLAAGHFGADGPMATALGSAISGVGTGLVVALWAELFVASCKGREMVALLFAGVTASALLDLALSFLPMAALALLLVLLPMASIAFICLGARAYPRLSFEGSRSVKGAVSWRFVAFCLVFPIPLGLFRTWFHAGQVTLAGWAPIFAVSAGALVGVFLLDSALFRRRRFSIAEKLVMPATVAGLFFLVALDAGAALVSGIFVFAAQQVMSVVLYARFGQIAVRDEVSPVKVFALGISATDCGFITGIVAANLMPPAASGHGLYMVLGVVYLVVIAAFLNAGGLLPKSKEAAAVRTVKDGSMRVSDVARDHDLTPREGEILEYLLRGKSVPAIASEVLLSVNTVRTHVAHIYQKFDVHSRDELVALVDDELQNT